MLLCCWSVPRGRIKEAFDSQCQMLWIYFLKRPWEVGIRMTLWTQNLIFPKSTFSPCDRKCTMLLHLQCKIKKQEDSWNAWNQGLHGNRLSTARLLISALCQCLRQGACEPWCAVDAKGNKEFLSWASTFFRRSVSLRLRTWTIITSHTWKNRAQHMASSASTFSGLTWPTA